MKVMTVLGTRPEIIRLSLLIPLLDRHADHVLVHTGQNYDDRLSGLFFRELDIRHPDLHLGVQESTFGAQVGQMLARLEPVLLQHRPERLLVLGDTNSGLAALLAKRLGIAVYHMEAGNRCFDDRVPEEVNRRAIDHASTVLLPYTGRSRENLLREGIPSERIFVTGNPIKQVLDHHRQSIGLSGALGTLELEEHRYFLVTMHRAENVDREDKLRSLVQALVQLHAECGFPVVVSLHPRTRAKVEQFGVETDIKGLRFVAPLGFFDFVRLESAAACVISDSGTVQEETCILGTPNVTIREVTERPETVECGSNILAGTAPKAIVKAARFVMEQGVHWVAPAEYLRTDVAETVCRIVLGSRILDPGEIEWRERLRG